MSMEQCLHLDTDMKKKKYIIQQKSVQTDYYEVEATSLREALQVYKSSSGELMSSGSTGGWGFGDSEDIVVIEAKEDEEK